MVVARVCSGSGIVRIRRRSLLVYGLGSQGTEAPFRGTRPPRLMLEGAHFRLAPAHGRGRARTAGKKDAAARGKSAPWFSNFDEETVNQDLPEMRPWWQYRVQSGISTGVAYMHVPSHAGQYAGTEERCIHGNPRG